MTASLTVAILTYKRHEMLSIALDAVCAQATELNPPAQVLVIDNDPAGSARGVVDRHPKVRYFVEATPGVVAGRNRALDEARTRLLAFIDDDEIPERGWLAALAGAQHDFDAAAVAGPVRNEITEHTHPWIVQGAFLSRAHRAGLSTGDLIDEAATNNLLLDLSVVTALGLRFDPAYALTGGEDVVFTRAITASGARMVWCREAVVVDRAQAGRANSRWIMRKAMRYGTTDVRMQIIESGALIGRSISAASGAAMIIVGLAQSAHGSLRGNPRRRGAGVVRAARGLGRVLGALGCKISEYGRG